MTRTPSRRGVTQVVGIAGPPHWHCRRQPPLMMMMLPVVGCQPECQVPPRRPPVTELARRRARPGDLSPGRDPDSDDGNMMPGNGDGSRLMILLVAAVWATIIVTRTRGRVTAGWAGPARHAGPGGARRARPGSADPARRPGPRTEYNATDDDDSRVSAGRRL